MPRHTSRGVRRTASSSPSRSCGQRAGGPAPACRNAARRRMPVVRRTRLWSTSTLSGSTTSPSDQIASTASRETAPVEDRQRAKSAAPAAPAAGGSSRWWPGSSAAGRGGRVPRPTDDARRALSRCRSSAGDSVRRCPPAISIGQRQSVDRPADRVTSSSAGPAGSAGRRGSPPARRGRPRAAARTTRLRARREADAPRRPARRRCAAAPGWSPARGGRRTTGPSRPPGRRRRRRARSCPARSAGTAGAAPPPASAATFWFSPAPDPELAHGSSATRPGSDTLVRST